MLPSVNDHKRKQNGQFIRNKCKNKHRLVSSYIQKCKPLTYKGGDGENVTQPKGNSIQDEIRSNNSKKRVITPTFCYKVQVANLFRMSLVSGCEQKLFRLYFSCTKGRLSETL